MEDKEVFYGQLERLAIVLDGIMPGCATLVRDTIATLKEQEETIENLNQAVKHQAEIIEEAIDLCKSCQKALERAKERMKG